MELQPSKILVVDDFRHNRIALNKVLQPLDNIELVEASSGSEALAKLINNEFALILLDVNMPNMDGYEVAELISSTQAHKHTPIVMLTAHDSSTKDIMRAYEVGAIDYLTKPIESTILLNKVKQFVKISQLQAKTNYLRSEREVILEAAGQGVIKFNSEGKVQFINSKACQLLQSDNDSLLGTQFNLWFKTAEREPCHDDLFLFLRTQANAQGIFQQRVTLYVEDNKTYLVELTCTSAKKQLDASMIVLFQDISDRLEMENRLIHLANYDTLTQLCNRGSFHEQLKRALGRAKRVKSTVALLFLDLDRFKQINDTLGHDVGDELLKGVAERLRLVLRESDIAGRLGGDEFAILLEDCHSSADAELVAKKLVDSIRKPFVLHGKEILIETSIGISCSDNGEHNITTLLKWADIALYAAKSAGRNCHQLFIPAMSAKAQKHAVIQSKLRKIIERDLLDVHYQGQYSLTEKRFVGFEALVRWPRNGFGKTPISPGLFIPIAEQSHLIHKLGIQTLKHACRLLQAWQSSTETQHLSIAVNLSAKQINSQDFLSTTQATLDQFSFPRAQLTFELTETAFLDNTENVVKTMNSLKDMGFMLALDDFGTGYSSLSYLQKLPLDILKIDQCFVQRLGQCDKTSALVKAIITIAQAHDMNVVAEGVETKLQLDCIEQLGCSKIQGYYFSKPIPVDLINGLLNPQVIPIKPKIDKPQHKSQVN
ncbi:hypothetical protein A9R01_16335 ['Osedax' symbiont bacterium Rs2_46_30_T18]|nr:hypothetical protein A9R01_16335 ['Osedax' symbiont bacterium Rs2_46_30_T18]